MIKEEYIPLLFSHQIRVITTIGDTHTLAFMQGKDTANEWI